MAEKFVSQILECGDKAHCLLFEIAAPLAHAGPADVLYLTNPRMKGELLRLEQEEEIKLLKQYKLCSVDVHIYICLNKRVNVFIRSRNN